MTRAPIKLLRDEYVILNITCSTCKQQQVTLKGATRLERISTAQLKIGKLDMPGTDHDSEFNKDSFNTTPPHGSVSQSLDDICLQIDTGFQALSESLGRKTWTFTPSEKSTSHSIRQRLQAAEWQYTRINELWRVHNSHSNGGPSGRLGEWMTERLLRLVCVLTESTRAVSRRRKSSVDYDASLLSLEVALESLNDAMRTCTLSAELDELIREGYSTQ